MSTSAADSRAKALRDLNVEYPFWIFDVDQPAWPRRLANILPNSHPARLTGWLSRPWEYGTSLDRIDDPLPYGMISTRDRHPRVLGSIQAILNRLRFDDTYDPDTFTVLFEGGSAEQAQVFRPLREWVFDGDGGGDGGARGGGGVDYVAPRRIVRIERRWDAVPMWDREAGLNLFDNPESPLNGCYGVTTMVHDDEELVAAAGVDPNSKGEEIRRAEFSLLGDRIETARGVVYPGRMQKGRGLIISRGPQYPHNRAILTDTALEDADWSEVLEYVLKKRIEPLWR